jgi:hypothetical protein
VSRVFLRSGGLTTRHRPGGKRRTTRGLALDSLFPSGRQGVLAATLTHPEKWWYLSELAEFLDTRPSSLQRELRSLEQSGILQQRRDGRRTYLKHRHVPRSSANCGAYSRKRSDLFQL